MIFKCTVPPTSYKYSHNHSGHGCGNILFRQTSGRCFDIGQVYLSVFDHDSAISNMQVYTCVCTIIYYPVDRPLGTNRRLQNCRLLWFTNLTRSGYIGTAIKLIAVFTKLYRYRPEVAVVKRRSSEGIQLALPTSITSCFTTAVHAMQRRSRISHHSDII